MTKGKGAALSTNNAPVLPVGEKFAGSRSQMKTIDHSNALPQFKKKAGSGVSTTVDFFNQQGPQVRPRTAGQRLHTDPFAADREHYIPPTKRLMEVAEKPEKATGVRHLPVPEHKDGDSTLISANGLVFRGGKCTNPHRFDTTMDREPVKVNYAQMARFKSVGAREYVSPITSPTKQAPQNFNARVMRKARTTGTKRIPGCSDKTESLVGVLTADTTKPKRQYTYRPPWGTCNTPRTAPGARKAPQAGPTPWATERTAVPVN